MTNETGLDLCGWVCWIIGVIAGILAYLMSQGAVGWLPALLVGLAVAIFLGLVLRATFCKGAESGAAEVGAPSGAADDAGATTAAMAAGGASAVAAGAATGEESEAAAKDAAARAASEKAEAEKTAEAKVQTAPETKPESKPEAKPEPAKAKTATKAPAAKEAAASSAETKPLTLDTPRAGGADDLKLIGGVGPKLEQTLNELGFWHFDQIADWGPEEIAWVDSRLRFKGRIERDDWMSQAKTLAEGGETEFSKKKRKG